MPHEHAPGPSDRDRAERYAIDWYENYSRNGGRVLGFMAPSAPRLTTQSEYESWLRLRENNPKIKAATWKQNVSHQKMIFAHPMSNKPLLELTPADARDFVVYARERKGGRAAYTVRNLVNSYSAFLGSRLELPANPFHHDVVRTELPTARPRWGRDKPHIDPQYVPAFPSRAQCPTFRGGAG